MKLRPYRGARDPAIHWTTAHPFDGQPSKRRALCGFKPVLDIWPPASTPVTCETCLNFANELIAREKVEQVHT